MIETPLRERIDLCGGWEFAKGRVSRGWLQGRGGGGEIVDLPHCWNRSDTYQPGRRSFSGRGAYRRTIDLPTAPEGPGAWRLRSEGFYGYGDVWLDGRAIARIDGQYLGFDVGLPDPQTTGRHVLALRLDNLFQRRVLPGRRDPDFLLYGGLAGRVWLEWIPAFHINEKTTDVVCTPGPNGAEILELRCRVNGMETAQENPRLSWTITTEEGEQIAAAGPAPVTDATSSVSTMVLKPRCWSTKDPQLHWAQVQIETDEGLSDAAGVRFGMTRAEFRTGKGFFLDGARVDLHGWNRHESIPGLGNALSEELHRADARILKDYGCNFVRLSHYPQHQAFLDACDELGILVYAEIATWKSVQSSAPWRRAARRQMRDLILRDRHHPSVIVWGMGNESRSRTAFLELRDIALELDPTRPTTYAENHLYRARREKTVGIPEVWSVNYELDKLEEARDACSLRTVIVAECCNNPYSFRGDDHAELTQVATLEYEWKVMADRPYLAGHAVWSFADYATEYRNRYRRQNGLFDAWRKPKMAAELFRARYAKDPFVSLFVTDSRDASRELQVFSNCDRVRITFDGEGIVELEGELHYVVNIDGQFKGASAEGILGETAVRERLNAWGDAQTVAMTANGKSLPGQVVVVDLSIHDSTGNQVHDWNGHLHLDADGDSTLYPYTDSGEVLITRGEGRSYLQLGLSGGEVVIHATADGLEPGTKTITPSAVGATDT